MMCPECGAENYKEGIQCPLHNGEAVCMTCCKSCKYHSKDVYSFPCKFHQANPHHNVEKKIDSLNRRIESAEEEVRRLNHRRNFREARNVELRIQKMVQERRRLEEKENDTTSEKENRKAEI